MTEAEAFARFMLANGLMNRPYRERLLAAKAFLAGHEMLCTQLRPKYSAWPDDMIGTGQAPAGDEYIGCIYVGS